MNSIDIDELIQTLRTLRISQLRKQLEQDEKHNLDRYLIVANFINLAKEQM